MDKSAMIDKALAMLGDDMDDMEGSGAMQHSLDDCPDPLSCTMHDSELGENLSPGDKEPAAVKIEISKGGLPSMEGAKEESEEPGEGLSPEDAEMLKKLLK